MNRLLRKTIPRVILLIAAVAWILCAPKAEGDVATANRKIRVRKSPNFDAVCFHAQQCVEKYLKALLQEANLPFGKTHPLISLLDLLLSPLPSWEIFRPHLQNLNACSVSSRYPGGIRGQRSKKGGLVTVFARYCLSDPSLDSKAAAINELQPMRWVVASRLG
jgi:HEPN domain-containing protein